MRKFLERYKWGFDFWALILFAMLMLPNIIYWCIPGYSDLGGDGLIDTFANILQVFGVGLLVFLVQKEKAEKKKKYFFDSLFMTVTLLILLYYAAWFIYFFGTLNTGVILFLAGCPCIALVLFAIERKNYIALVPLAIFSILHIISALQLAIALALIKILSSVK